MQLVVEEVHEQFIFCKIICGSFSFQLAAVYGLHTISDRKRHWDNYLSSKAMSTKLMIVMGDFNVFFFDKQD